MTRFQTNQIEIKNVATGNKIGEYFYDGSGMVDNEHNVYLYLGGGLGTPGFASTITYSPDTVTSGFNVQGSGTLGFFTGAGGIRQEQYFDAEEFGEFGVSTSPVSASATGFYVFCLTCPNARPEPQVEIETDPNANIPASVNSSSQANRINYPNCACSVPAEERN